jgi:hypothetical protein
MYPRNSLVIELQEYDFVAAAEEEDKGKQA